jgi:hypothetical protein
MTITWVPCLQPENDKKPARDAQVLSEIGTLSIAMAFVPGSVLRPQPEEGRSPLLPPEMRNKQQAMA